MTMSKFRLRTTAGFKVLAQMRLMTMGLILLLVLRFTPRGLIPEEKR